MPGVDPDDIDDIVAQVGAIYREGELALVRQVGRHLEKYPGAPTATVGEPRLEAVGALRRSVEVIQAGLQADGSRAIREGLASAWQLGTRAALVDIPEKWFEKSGIGRAAETARRLIPQQGAIEALATALVRDVGAVVANVLRDALDAYRGAIAGGAARMLVGGQTRRQATQAAWANLVDKGITGFVDRSNRRWRLSSYAEMAMRTASARAAVQGQDDRLASLDLDLVYISDHVQECGLCRPFEGRVLHRVSGPSGPVRVEHAIEDDVFLTVDVAGSVASARAAGLWHPNCRHSMSAYLPGVTRIPEGKPDPKGYEARMRQRHIERTIRKWKERQAGATTDEARKAAGKKVHAWQAAMRQHLDDHPNLKRLRYREQPGAGSTPPRDQDPDTATPIGPDVQPTLDGTGGEQVRRTPRSDDEQDTRARDDEQVPGQVPFEEAAAEAERERQEAEEVALRAAEEEAERIRLEEEARARLVASDDTRQRINEVHEQLPRTAEEWAATLPTERYRPIDERLARARAAYWSAAAAVAQKVEDNESEFKRKRTPHDRRRALMAEALVEEKAAVAVAQDTRDAIEELIERHDREGPDALTVNERTLFDEQERTTYPTDSAGNRMPPQALLDHLDGVLDVGDSILTDAERVFESDPEMVEIRARYKREEPGTDEFRAARREWARRESEILRAVLGSVVDLGGHEQRVGEVADDAPPTWRDQLRTAERYYPTGWLRAADQAGPLDVQHDPGGRAFFRRGSDDRRDLMAFRDPWPDVYLGQFTDDAYETTVHEMGHRMEAHVPGLTYLEFALQRQASTQPDGDLEPWRRLRDLAGGGYGENELTAPDNWSNPYAGKTYEGRDLANPARQSWEIFQTAAQDVWGRGTRPLTNREGRKFVLGVLATLHRREPVELLDPPVESLTDDQLAERIMDAFMDGDLDAAARFEAELDRRAELEREREEETARRRQAAEQRRAEREDRQYAEIARLVEEEGYDWEDAAAEILGVTVERIRRQDYTRTHRVGDTDRRDFRTIAREQYRLFIERQVVAAENATNGYLLTPEGQSRGIDPASLFSGPRARAERWASEELKRWWDANGRVTFAEFVEQIEQGRTVGDVGRDYNR